MLEGGIERREHQQGATRAARIDGYRFGRVVVDGPELTRDVIALHLTC